MWRTSVKRMIAAITLPVFAVLFLVNLVVLTFSHSPVYLAWMALDVTGFTASVVYLRREW